MPIIDRIKFDGIRSRDWIIYKHPADNIVFGGQLIVGEGQNALFVKSGRICDVFSPGTYTLNSSNIPILQGLINIPFGGKTPFTAEVFYINTTSMLDLNWGTSNPIQLIDPKYYTKLRVRAFGQLGLKLVDCSLFLRELIGVVNPADIVSYEKVKGYFRGLLNQKMKTIIADIIINQKISALEVTAKLDEIAGLATHRILQEFARFGLNVVNFYIQSINFPDEDFEAINAILKNRAEFEIMGDHRYATKRTYDVYESAAANESGVAGAFAAGGLGLGVGASLVGHIPSMPVAAQSVAAHTMICPGCAAVNSGGHKFCSSCGQPLSLASRKCTACGSEIATNARFCPLCGVTQAQKKCDCGAQLDDSAIFCQSCGKKVST